MYINLCREKTVAENIQTGITLCGQSFCLGLECCRLVACADIFTAHCFVLQRDLEGSDSVLMQEGA